MQTGASLIHQQENEAMELGRFSEDELRVKPPFILCIKKEAAILDRTMSVDAAL